MYCISDARVVLAKDFYLWEITESYSKFLPFLPLVKSLKWLWNMKTLPRCLVFPLLNDPLGFLWMRTKMTNSHPSKFKKCHLFSIADQINQPFDLFTWVWSVCDLRIIQFPINHMKFNNLKFYFSIRKRVEHFNQVIKLR